MTSGSLRFVGLLMFAAAAMRIVALVFSGFAGGAMAGLIWAVFLVAAGAGIMRGWRWLGWIAMMAMLISVGITAAAPGVSAGPDLIFYLMIALEGLAVLILFLALWQPRKRAEP